MNVAFDTLLFSISVDTTTVERGQQMLSQLPKPPLLPKPTPRLTHGWPTTPGDGTTPTLHTLQLGTTHTGEDITTLERGQLMLRPPLLQLLMPAPALIHNGGDGEVTTTVAGDIQLTDGVTADTLTTGAESRF